MLVNSIQSTDYRCQSQPAFTGVTNLMRRQIFIDGKKDVMAVLQKRPGKNTRVGELPGFMFERIEQSGIQALYPGKTLADIRLFGKDIQFKEFKAKAIDEIMSTFEECAEQIRNFRPGALAPVEETRNRRPQAVVDKLKAVFEKYGLIDDPEKFNLKYLGEGEYKKAFKIEGVKDPKTGESMCFKVFHTVDTTPEWHKYKCHGNFSEINIAMYWKKNVGMYTQRNKFYFGDINRGYLVDRHVDHTVPKVPKTITEYDYGVKIVDEVKAATGHNKIAGYSIDEGGSRVVNRIKNQSSTARYVLKQIKNTPEDQRLSEWFRILKRDTHLDEVQRKAGLALSIKHMPENVQEQLINVCIDFNEPLVDQALAYALKYLPLDKSLNWFAPLMRRKDPITQTVLMNEIPLLSRKESLGVRFDDINTPRFEIDPDTVLKFYNKAKQYVLPSVEEHLASYVHLLPKEDFSAEVNSLVRRGNYDILDRLLHKVKFVTEAEGYSFGDKMEVIEKVKSHTTNDFLQKKAEEIRVKLIRDSLDAE